MATKYYIGGLKKGQKAPKWSSTSGSQVKNPKTKLIQQEDAYGCAVACLAMALGKTYKEMLVPRTKATLFGIDSSPPAEST